MQYFMPFSMATPRRRNREKRMSFKDFIREYEEFQEFLEQKKKDTKKKEEVKQGPRFTFLETAGLCFILGPWLGVGTLYGIKIMINNMELMLR